jgi:hypothetical protein
MRVAIMQPYFLPYIGYWQLIAAVDVFVLLDDVHYINRGWIARNRIAIAGKAQWLTLPLQGASQNRLICDLDLLADDGWRARMEKTVRHAYSKAPCFEETFAPFAEMLGGAQGNLSAFLAKSIAQIASLLGVRTKIIPTSKAFPKGELRGPQRIIDICKRLGATEYVNPSGGTELYDAREFHEAEIRLYFLGPPLADSGLRSGSGDGTTLSILDTLMMNDIGAVSRFFSNNLTLEPKS